MAYRTSSLDGHVCFPASEPGDGCPPFDCTHAEVSHYSIDGEAVGCTECEAIEDARHAAADPCCPAFPDCLHPIPRGDREAISEALVAPLFCTDCGSIPHAADCHYGDFAVIVRDGDDEEGSGG